MQSTDRTSRRGGVLVLALVIAVSMAGLCAALLSMNLSNEKALVRNQYSQRSFYTAEAGLSDAYVQLSAGLIAPKNGAHVRVGQPGAGLKLGPSSYWVDVSEAGLRTFSLVSTGIDGWDETRLELLVSRKATGFFQFAAFGANGVQLDSNAFIDSYDSAYGPYDSQVQGGNDYARENGDIGSNRDIVLRSNTEIHGDASPGPRHVVDDSAPGAYISGSKDPLEKNFELPPIVVPSVPSSGSLVGNSTIIVGPGDVHYDGVLMRGGSTLKVIGPARLIARDFHMRSGANLTFDSSGGKIEMYVAEDFMLESNSRVTTLSNSALDVTLFLNGNNLTGGRPDRLQLGANSSFIGAIYAPNAEFSLASNFDVYGSVMCGRLDLSSNGEIHFDEALLYDGHGATGELEARFWRHMPNP